MVVSKFVLLENIAPIAAFLYSIALIFSDNVVSLTQQPIEQAIIRSSLYDRIAMGFPFAHTNVLISAKRRDEYILISLFLTNSSNLAMISGLVLDEVVNPAMVLLAYSASMDQHSHD
jgi:hypothetical protein